MIKPKSTTIKLSKETKDKLDKLKIYRRETYDDVLITLIKFKENKND